MKRTRKPATLERSLSAGKANAVVDGITVYAGDDTYAAFHRMAAFPAADSRKLAFIEFACTRFIEFSHEILGRKLEARILGNRSGASGHVLRPETLEAIDLRPELRILGNSLHKRKQCIVNTRSPRDFDLPFSIVWVDENRT